jgi:probable selenium-dependent hydroxylase accessory protein YqeC
MQMPFYSLIHADPQKIRGQIVSVIGGGGKSSLLQKIGKELAEKNLRVILTSTTKFQPFPQIGIVLIRQGDSYASELDILLTELKIAQVAKDYYEKDRFVGINILDVQELSRFADVVLIEADGSRQRSLKTHKEHEPVIPPFSTSVIVISGCDVVGESLNDRQVHRSELFSEKWQLPIGTKLTPEIISKELLSPHSYLRNVPLRAAVSYFISKADENPIGAKLLSEHLFRKSAYPVFVGSIHQNRLRKITIDSLTPETLFQ